MNYGYIRVSSDKQTVENQRFEIENFAKQNGLWDLIRVWEQYREEVLTPSLNQYETSEQKVYRLAEQL